MTDLTNTPLLQAYRGRTPVRRPIWFMRQAGRYLPEYQAIRGKHSMLDVIRTPALAAEVTLQPLRRFDLDGSIIFSDLLSPLIGMGIELDFVAGRRSPTNRART
jgi:uroporphyrinogen decarboxylase